MRKTLALLLIVALSAMTLFVGCGEDSSSKPATTPTTTHTPSRNVTDLGTVDCSNGFMTKPSSWITAEGDFQLTFEFDYEGLLSASKMGYETPIIEFSTEGINNTANASANYYSFVCNGNAWNWNGATATTTWTQTPANAVVIDDASVPVTNVLSKCSATLTVSRSDATISFTATLTNGVNTVTWNGSVTDPNIPTMINIRMGAEYGKLINLKCTR